MGINRTKHDAENPYTVISDQMLRDMELSLKAKAILCMCLSFSETWQFNAKDLTTRFKINKNLLNKYLAELEAKNYLIRKTLRNQNGCVTGVQYEFYEIPYIKKQNPEKQNSVKPYPEKQVPEKQDLVKPYPENQPLRINNLKEYQFKESSKSKIAKSIDKLKLIGKELNYAK